METVFFSNHVNVTSREFLAVYAHWLSQYMIILNNWLLKAISYICCNFSTILAFVMLFSTYCYRLHRPA